MRKAYKYQEYRACARKKAFYTTKAANIAVHKQRQYGRRMSYYRCRFCGKYHLTHERRNKLMLDN